MSLKDRVLTSLETDTFGEDFAIRWAVDEVTKRREQVTRFLDFVLSSEAPTPSARKRPREDAELPSSALDTKQEQDETTHAAAPAEEVPSQPKSFAAMIRAARARQQQAAGTAMSAAIADVPSPLTSEDVQKESVVSSGGIPPPVVPASDSSAKERRDEDDDESFDVHLAFSAPPPRSTSRLQDATQQALAEKWTSLPEGDSLLPLPPPEAQKHPSQMTKEEYMQQFKRAPRRGEIGISAERIVEAEALGYVMSGSRKKEATKYIDRVQKQLHEREAAKMRLQFLQEEDRRNDSEAMNEFIKLAMKSASAQP